MRKLIVSGLITLGLAGALSANEDLLASVTTGKVDGTSFELSKEDNLKIDGGWLRINNRPWNRYRSYNTYSRSASSLIYARAFYSGGSGNNIRINRR